MLELNKIEQQMIADALQMAIDSNRRQEKSKPQYSVITKQIDIDLNNVLQKVKSLKTK